MYKPNTRLSKKTSPLHFEHRKPPCVHAESGDQNPSSVRIESGMPFEKLAEEFRNSDVVVYPSYYEGQGLIPLESMASGTPVATVDHGPLPEMVDDSVGALFTMADIDSMSSAILSLLSDPEVLEVRGKAGRERVLEYFTYGQNAEEFSQIYSQLTD